MFMAIVINRGQLSHEKTPYLISLHYPLVNVYITMENGSNEGFLKWGVPQNGWFIIEHLI